MPRTGEIFRAAIKRLQNRVGAIGSGDASGNAFTGIDGYRKSRPTLGRIVCHHERECKLIAMLGEHRHTNQATAMACHEGDRLGGCELGGDRQIALVLPVGGVDDDDELALSDVLDRLFNGRERRLLVELDRHSLDRSGPHSAGGSNTSSATSSLIRRPRASPVRTQTMSFSRT